MRVVLSGRLRDGLRPLTPLKHGSDRSMGRAPVLIVALVAVAVGAHGAYPPTTTGWGGAVACADPTATEIGVRLLEDGGNAADAAVGVALALAVVHPQAGNLGGGGFAVVRFDGKAATLDFREVAPAGATREMFLDEAGRPVRERSLVGPLAAGVPGSPAGLFALHERYGALPWSRVVAPAERLARNGFIVTRRLSRSIEEHEDLLRRFAPTRRVWLPGGRAPSPGDRMRLPALASTLEAYGARGPTAITTGTAARAVEAASSAHGGVLRAEDLAAYRPRWRDAVRFEAFGWQTASMDLPSSGGVILGTTASALELLGWSEEPRFGAARAHLLVEAWRRAYADRYALGDPGTTEMTTRELLKPARIEKLAAGIDRRRATPSGEVGPRPDPVGRSGRQTTHLSVVDGTGDAVSLTTTLNGSFGCGLLVPETGFLLNNEMDDFASKPGTANLYGLVQGEANAVAPGKRMLSSMSPSVVWRGGAVVALGSPGGSRIPNATLQVLLNVVVDGDDLESAVGRPRLHHQWLPDRIEAEPDAFAPETAAELRSMGHAVRIVQSIGCVNIVRRFADGRSEAAADPRGPGSADVVRKRPVPEETGAEAR